MPPLSISEVGHRKERVTPANQQTLPILCIEQHETQGNSFTASAWRGVTEDYVANVT